MSLKVVYLGDASGTSRHRAEAMKRLGWNVEVIDPRARFHNSRSAEFWIWRGGSLGMEKLVQRYVLSQLRSESYDVAIVNHGELVGPGLVCALRNISRGVLHFNLDNPFVARDKQRWRLMRKALPYYDAMATPRASTVEEGLRRGARHMLQFKQCADEVVHTPSPFQAADAACFASDVSFIGTWMPERGALVRRLIEAGVSVKIFGPNWEKAPDYAAFAPAVAINRPLGDDSYPKAIQYARIALGFLSAENLDEHTSRSAEVPAIGTLLCAQRTGDHMDMYKDGEEAVFWNDINDCARECLGLLAAPERLSRIAAAGAARQRLSGNWNEQLMARLVDRTLSLATVKSKGSIV